MSSLLTIVTSISLAAVARGPRPAVPHHRHGPLHHARPMSVPRRGPFRPAQSVRPPLRVSCVLSVLKPNGHLRSTETLVGRLIKYNADRGIILWCACHFSSPYPAGLLLGDPAASSSSPPSRRCVLYLHFSPSSGTLMLRACSIFTTSTHAPRTPPPSCTSPRSTVRAPAYPHLRSLADPSFDPQCTATPVWPRMSCSRTRSDMLSGADSEPVVPLTD